MIVAGKATLNCGARTIDWDGLALALVATFTMLRIKVEGEQSDMLSLKLINTLFSNMAGPFLIESKRIESDYLKADLLGLLNSLDYATA